MRYSLADLGNYLEKIERYILSRTPGRGFSAIAYSLFVAYKGQNILQLEHSSVRITAPPALEGDAVEILDRAGVFPLQLEFMQAAPFTPIENSIGKTNGDFNGWLAGLMDTLNHNVQLIPDTNFLRRHYYSNHILPLLAQMKAEAKPRFGLSRLTILEVENKYARAQKDRRTKNKGQSAQGSKQAEESDASVKAAKEVRIGFHTIKEILALKRTGGMELPDLDMGLMQTFADNAEEFGDAWIRREIAWEIPSVFRDGKSRDVSRLLMTCDLMNALAAIAEGINTIYVARIEEPQAVGYVTRDFAQQALIIMNAAIQFGECDCSLELADEVKTFKIIGMWSGKSMNDWLNDVIMREGDEKSTLD